MTKTLSENRWFYTENGIKDANWNLVFKSEVLAPVPTYEEWKEIDDELKELATKNDTLSMENGRLQEQFRIATKALKKMAKDSVQCAEQALEEIELRKVK